MSSATIYSDFKPTYLYIKQHTITGLLYFGKTVNDPEKYPGSGTIWKAHIKKHGKEHVVTLWCYLFTDRALLMDVALIMSTQFNIVDSKNWANLILENGINGGAVKDNNFVAWSKLPKTAEHKRKQSEKMISIQTDPNSKSKRNRMKKCMVDGITFDSITAASKHFGVSEMGVQWWFKNGRAQRLDQ